MQSNLNSRWFKNLITKVKNCAVFIPAPIPTKKHNPGSDRLQLFKLRMLRIMIELLEMDKVELATRTPAQINEMIYELHMAITDVNLEVTEVSNFYGGWVSGRKRTIINQSLNGVIEAHQAISAKLTVHCSSHHL